MCWITTAAAVCWLLFAPTASASLDGAADLVAAPAAASRALFFDSSWLSAGVNNGTGIRLHRPVQTTDAPILYSSMEYENLRLWGYASAVDNGTHILMYYMVMSTLGQDAGKVAMYTALAISSDGGATFVKPELGLVDVGDGGKNNIIWPLISKTVSGSGDHQTGTVWIDTKPATPPSERYKMLALWNPGTGMGTYAWSSADGIHFSVMGDERKPLYTGSDTQQVGFYDSQLQKYVAYRRNWPSHRINDASGRLCVGDPARCGPTYLGGRKVGRCVSDTLTSFEGCNCSCADAGQGATSGCTGEGASCTFQVFSYDADDAPIVDIYTNQAAQYQGHYLLFPSIYLHYPNPPAWPCGNDGLWFSRLVHSAPSDGARFSYVGGDREAWLSSGEAGQAPPAECASSPEGSAWDSAMVGVAQGIIEQPDGGITMFKYGDNLRHGQCTDGKLNHNWAGNCSKPSSSRGGGFVRVQLRQDGFASLSTTSHGRTTHHWAASAIVETVQMKVSAPSRLYVNAQALSGGKLVVIVLDASGAVVEGATPSAPLLGDHRSWRADGAAIAAGTVSLRFEMSGQVDIYSFWLAPVS